MVLEGFVNVISIEILDATIGAGDSTLVELEQIEDIVPLVEKIITKVKDACEKNVMEYCKGSTGYQDFNAVDIKTAIQEAEIKA